MVEVSTSILSVQEENCIKAFYNLEAAHTDYFHIDVMDGEFVEKNTIDKMIKYCEYIKNISNIPLDVHLMVKDEKKYIEEFALFEPNIITVHFESMKKEEVGEIISLIKDKHCRVGISVKPNTNIEEIYEWLPFVNLVLVMTVEPGKGGQKLIDSTVEKIRALKKYISENDLDVDIEADGGINTENAEILKAAGVNVIVAGTAILNSSDYKETVESLKI